MNTFCPFCEQETKINEITENEVMDIRGEMISVQRKFYRCEACGEEFTIPTNDYDPFDAAYREYRRRKGWAQPEEIKEFREKLGLTQQQLSHLLGIGIATLNRYENGALQSESNNQLISICLEDPWALLQFVKNNKNVFSEDQLKDLITHIEKSQGNHSQLVNEAVKRYGAYPPSIMSGGKCFDFKKLCEVIKFFCYGREIFTTKLLKLLFYADFKHYKDYGVSMTGTRYARLPFGPAPDNYKTWLAACTEWVNIVESMVREFEDYSGEVYTTHLKPDLDHFSPDEIGILGFVKNYFKEFSSVQMEDFSHQEIGYKETKNSSLISYEYAKDLQI